MTPDEQRILELYHRDLSCGHIAAIFRMDPDDVVQILARLLKKAPAPGVEIRTKKETHT